MPQNHQHCVKKWSVPPLALDQLGSAMSWMGNTLTSDESEKVSQYVISFWANSSSPIIYFTMEPPVSSHTPVIWHKERERK